MKPKRMSLKEIQSVLSRDEMKKIMAGSGNGSECSGSCNVYVGGVGTVNGECRTTSWPGYDQLCYCSNGIGSCV